MAKRRKALQHLRLRGLSPVAEGGTKADLTTGMTTDRKNFDCPSRRDIMAEIEYPGVAKLVSRLIWVREAGVRAALFQNPGKLWDAKADGVLPHAGNWSKTGVDPIFDHNQKTS